MSQEFCSECGKSLAVGAKFCSDCGQPVAGGSPRDEREPATGGNWKRDGLIVVGIILVVVVGYLYMRETPQQPVATEMTTPPDHEGMGSAIPNMPTDYAELIEGGNQFMDAGNFPMAAEMYRRALEIDATSPDVRTDFGSCLNRMGLAERALEEFRTVYQEHPEHATVRYNMGIVHFGLGRTDSAKIYWEEYLQLAPDGGAAGSARGYLEGMVN
jgi:cytochrome c-type biogenesis protein CcmH/NrfG